MVQALNSNLFSRPRSLLRCFGRRPAEILLSSCEEMQKETPVTQDVDDLDYSRIGRLSNVYVDVLYPGATGERIEGAPCVCARANDKKILRNPLSVTPARF